MMSRGRPPRLIGLLGAQRLASDGAFKFHPDPGVEPQRPRNVALTQVTHAHPDDPPMTTEVVAIVARQESSGTQIHGLDLMVARLPDQPAHGALLISSCLHSLSTVDFTACCFVIASGSENRYKRLHQIVMIPRTGSLSAICYERFDVLLPK